MKLTIKLSDLLLATLAFALALTGRQIAARGAIHNATPNRTLCPTVKIPTLIYWTAPIAAVGGRQT